MYVYTALMLLLWMQGIVISFYVARALHVLKRNGSLQFQRILLQRLVKCLDQKVTTVRQQSTCACTGNSLLAIVLVLSVS